MYYVNAASSPLLHIPPPPVSFPAKVEIGILFVCLFVCYFLAGTLFKRVH